MSAGPTSGLWALLWGLQPAFTRGPTMAPAEMEEHEGTQLDNLRAPRSLLCMHQWVLSRSHSDGWLHRNVAKVLPVGLQEDTGKS
jgi:hypothetical protein